MSELDTLQIAQKVVNRLPKDMADELQSLILRYRDEQDSVVEIEIIDLLSSHENIRRWMKEQYVSEGQSDVTFRSDSLAGNHILAGNPSGIFISKRWICPRKGCAESLPVIQEGEDPPVCDQHTIEMMRDNAGKENHRAR